KLRIQSNSQAAITLVTKCDNSNNHHAARVTAFNALCSREWEVRIEHVYREANNVVDYLASSGHHIELGINSCCNSS
ncbi:hypothetical protein LINPERPRIM_LOCUS5100, partial [Linum perenne]